MEKKVVAVESGIVEFDEAASLCIDQNFIDRLQHALSQDQMMLMGTFEGLALDASALDTDVVDSFTDALHRRLSLSVQTTHAKNHVDASTVVADDSGNSVSLIGLCIGLVGSDIEASVDRIIENAPSAMNERKDTVLGKIMRYLRPDLWEEAQARYAEEDASYEITERDKETERVRHFNKVLSMLQGLQNDTGGTLVSALSKALLIDLAETISQRYGTQQQRARSSPISLPTREERLHAYRDGAHEEQEEQQACVVASGELSPENESTVLSEVLVQTRPSQEMLIPWIGHEPVEVDVLRYSQALNIDVIRGLSPALEKVAKAIDRNPINQQGQDKYEAIIDHLARRIATGVMPWQSANSVKRVRSKARSIGKGYPEAIWYTFDISPNAPRVYFTLTNEEHIDGDEKPSRQLIILSETDKAHQIEALREIMGISVKALRAFGAGSK